MPVSGLVNAWPCEEGSGLSVADVVGSEDGTILDNGDLSWYDDATKGMCLRVDGPDARVDFSAAFNLNDAGGCTITFWIKADFPSEFSGFLIGKAFDSGGNDRQFSVGISSFLGPTVEFRLRKGGTSTTESTHPTKLVTGTWHHIAMALDDNLDEIQCYIDGALPDTQAIGTSALYTDTTTKLTFFNRDGNTGGAPTQTTYFKDARVYSRYLSSSEVSDVAAEDPPGAGSDVDITAGTATTTESAIGAAIVVAVNVVAGVATTTDSAIGAAVTADVDITAGVAATSDTAVGAAVAADVDITAAAAQTTDSTVTAAVSVDVDITGGTADSTDVGTGAAVSVDADIQITAGIAETTDSAVGASLAGDVDITADVAVTSDTAVGAAVSIGVAVIVVGGIAVIADSAPGAAAVISDHRFVIAGIAGGTDTAPGGFVETTNHVFVSAGVVVDTSLGVGASVQVIGPNVFHDISDPGFIILTPVRTVCSVTPVYTFSDTE